MVPVILLAFANDKQNTGAGYLRGLTQERNAIRDALLKAEENKLCQVLVEPDATVDRIFDIFQNSTYRDRIAVFHYGGHAESYALLLESAAGGKVKAHSDGLVGFLSKQKSLKLVFLNGCSSQKQSEELVTAGLPAVIGTSQSISDVVATGLATRFYKGMSAGMNIERAWTDAIDQIKTENATDNTKNLFVEGILGTPGEQEFPWKLYRGEGAALSLAWNLPEAANQPLFGLELPLTYYRKLPATPYPGLRSFKREEAAIFFGRGVDIRKINTQLSREQPVILVSGKKGIGKSSLFAAGLAPRLETSNTIVHCTIHAENAIDDVLSSLQRSRHEHGLEKLAPTQQVDLDGKINALRSSISSTSAFVKELLEQELNQFIAIQKKEAQSYQQQWISLEEKSGLPVLFMLDELPHHQKSWQALVEYITDVFESGHTPKGKLIISVDEDDRHALCELLQASSIPYAEIFLQPLEWDNVHEAILGITNVPTTRDYYRLQIEQSNADNLPSTLAGDVLDGEHILVAPYLQTILTSMWESALSHDAQAPSFTLKQYHQSILSGDVMDKFLTQQLGQLKKWNTDVVDSGLALDLLYRHTSALGKSTFLDAAKRKQIYADRHELVESLVAKCKELFLLTGNPSQGTHLGHNLLAMVVIRQFSDSLSPGQQAARILKGKTATSSTNEQASWLNEKDLEVVEQGLNGMRSLTTEEASLLEYSRIKKTQLEKDRKRNRTIRFALGSVVALFAILAGWQWNVSHHRYLYSRAGELALTAREMLKEDNTLAMDIAHMAYSSLGKNSPARVVLALSDVFHTQDSTPFYVSSFPHNKKVFTAIFSPDGREVLTASEDGFATLWDRHGNKIKSFPHEIEVKAGIFSPNGQQILTLTRTHVYLWEHDGTLTDRDTVAETVTSLDSFSTDGMKIIPNSTKDLGAYFSSCKNLKQESNSVISSPGKNRIATIQNGVCGFFDEKGKAIKDTLAQHVYSASFSRDGKQFLIVRPGATSSNISIWSEAGDSIYSFHCRGTEVSASFSPDGSGILTASNDFTAKLWDFSQPFLHRFPKQTAAVNSIDFFAEGNRYVTASFDGTVRIWDGNGHIIDSLAHQDAVTSAVFSPDGQYIVTASRDSTALLWNPKERSIKVLSHSGKVASAVFSHDHKLVLTSGEDGFVRTWDFTGKEVGGTGIASEITLAVFSPDDQYILAVDDDNEVLTWRVGDDSIISMKHPAKVHSAMYSNDGKYIVTSCADSLARLWTKEGSLVRSFPHKEKTKLAIFTPDGNNILSGGRLIKIWTTSGTLVDSLPHADNVSSIAVSPDGAYYLTTCFDHNAYLWNKQGELQVTYKKHTEKISQGVFTPDGNYILTAGDDGYVYRWETPWAIFNELKSKPIYPLSAKEKELYGIIR